MITPLAGVMATSGRLSHIIQSRRSHSVSRVGFRPSFSTGKCGQKMISYPMSNRLSRRERPRANYSSGMRADSQRVVAKCTNAVEIDVGGKVCRGGQAWTRASNIYKHTHSHTHTHTYSLTHSLTHARTHNTHNTQGHENFMSGDRHVPYDGGEMGVFLPNMETSREQRA